MKKTLSLLITFALCLTGCSSSKTWTDVEQTFKQAEEEVTSITSNVDTVNKEEYEELLTELNDYVEDIEFSQDQENQIRLENVYKIAQYISVLSSLSSGNCTQQLLSLSIDTKDLVKAVYSGDKDVFNNIKNEITSQISNISNWADEQWSSVEHKTLILWDNVSSQFSEIEENTIDNLNAFADVTETELDGLKHTVLDNYEKIKNGVTKETDAIAKQMFEAAVKLQQYTKKIYSDEADTVYDFAKDIQSYIKQCYGKILGEDETLKNSIEDNIAAAKKWTQSTWNVITTQLKTLDRRH